MREEAREDDQLRVLHHLRSRGCHGPTAMRHFIERRVGVNAQRPSRQVDTKQVGDHVRHITPEKELTPQHLHAQGENAEIRVQVLPTRRYANNKDHGG